MGLMVVLVHTLGQKIAARMVNSSTETSLWMMDRYGLAKTRRFSKAMPAGLILPILLYFATFGWLKFTAITTFEAAALPRLKPFSKMTEMQLAMVALSGAIANVLFAFILSLFGQDAFAMMNLFFAFFNMIPFSTLDGIKVFFGSRMLWLFSMVFIISSIILFEVAGMWATILSAAFIAIAIVIAYYLSFENF